MRLADSSGSTTKIPQFQYNRGFLLPPDVHAPIVKKSEIDKVATLARLRVSPAEADEVTARIGEILAMIDRMQAVDTSGVEPLAHPLDAVQRLRADKVTEADRRDELLALAPSNRNGLFVVPKVIDAKVSNPRVSKQYS